MCLQFPHLDVCSCWCLHRRDFLNLCVVTKILYISLMNFFLFVRANKFWMKGLWLYLNRRAHQGSCSSYCTSAFQGFPASASTLVSRELPPAWVRDSFLLLEKEVCFFFLMSEISAALVRAEHRNCVTWHWSAASSAVQSWAATAQKQLLLARAVLVALAKKGCL